MNSSSETKVPTCAEYRAKMKANEQAWVNTFVLPEYRKLALRMRLRRSRPFVQHFLDRRKTLRVQGHTTSQAHALAIYERNLLHRRDDFRHIEELVDAGVSISRAVELMEPSRILKERIADLESHVEDTREQLESLQGQVEELQDQFDDLGRILDTLKDEQKMAWDEIASEHIAASACS